MRIDTSLELSFVLECICTEQLVVLGREEDWRSRNPVFRCKCGENLRLTNNGVEEEAFLAAE